MKNYQVEKEFDEAIIQVNRVSKKTKGGNRIGFSVLMAIGDGKGKVGVGLGRAPDVNSSIRKGIAVAKKNMINVPLQENTIPHQILIKKGASKIFFKPSHEGTGIVAGGVVRKILGLSGVRDISAKTLGTNNKIMNAYATIEALSKLKSKEQRAKRKDTEQK